MSWTIEQLLASLAVDEASVSVFPGGRFVLVQRDPQPLEEGLPTGTGISFVLVDLDADPLSPGISTPDFRVTAAGLPVVGYTGGVATFDPAWTGSITPFATTDPFVHWTLVANQVGGPHFVSEQVVPVVVQMVSAGLWGHGPLGLFPWGTPPTIPVTFDETYTFTIADLTPPSLLTAEPIDEFTVRLTFDDDMEEAPIVDLANWPATAIERLNVDPMPGASLEVVEVLPVDGNAAAWDLVFQWEQSPSCWYRVTVAAALTDTSGNPMDSAHMVASWSGYTWESPADRNFNIWRMMVPLKNRQEDATRDLERFINCFQEMLNLELLDLDRFIAQFDPDTCDDAYVDAMLYDLGNPFVWSELDLTILQRRKLVRLLVDIYRSKGTAPGIEASVYFLLGLVVRVVDYVHDGWVLGVDLLGDSDEVAMVMSGAAEPFDFSGGPADLTIEFQGVPQTAWIDPSGFVDPSAGTADEVAAALDAVLVGASAHVIAAGTPAVLTSVLAEPFPALPGLTLAIEVKGVLRIATFHLDDFLVPTAGTAAEAAARIQSDLPELLAYDDGAGKLVIESAAWGAGESLLLIGGTAATQFSFPGAIVHGSDAAHVEIQSDLWDEDAEVRVTGGAANAILNFSLDPAGGSGAAILGPSSSFIRYSFDLETDGVLSPQQEALVRRIANYMKPAHTHLLNVRPALTPPVPDAWTLGLSELGEDSDLAEV